MGRQISQILNINSNVVRINAEIVRINNNILKNLQRRPNRRFRNGPNVIRFGAPLARPN